MIVGNDDRKQIAELINENPELVLSIDLEALQVNVGEYSFGAQSKKMPERVYWMVALIP